MRYFKYLALLAVLVFPAVHSNAQVAIGVQIGPDYGLYNPPPVCDYGYYPYYPFDCAPYGYWGPNWFADGVFIGAGPWYNFYYEHPGFWRGYYGRFYGRGAWNGDRGWGGRGFEHFRGGNHGFGGGDRGFRGGNNGFAGGRGFEGNRGFEHFRGGDHGFSGGDRGFRGGNDGFNRGRGFEGGRGFEHFRGGNGGFGGRSFEGGGRGFQGGRGFSGGGRGFGGGGFHGGGSGSFHGGGGGGGVHGGGHGGRR